MTAVSARSRDRRERGVDAVQQQVEIPMGRNVRPSVLKRDRERRKAEKAAKKRERREQRKNEAPQSDVVSLEQEEDATGQETAVPDAPDQNPVP
jgi:hypothetical protein